eukprot:symbB.v1.2.007768.t1/scaffold480.1/size253386/30
MDGMLLKPRVVTTQMVPTPVLQADAGAGRGHHGHHGHHWEGVMVGLLTSSMGSIAQRCQRPKSNRLKAATKAVKTKITMCAEGEADPLLAEAKAAAEAAKLQLEAAKLRAEADELRRATATAQRKERAVRILGSEEVMGIGLPELMARLQEEGTELSGEEGLALAQAMGQEEPYFFRLDDLASEAFDKKLSEIQAEKLKARQAAEAAKREEERQAAANAASSSASPASQADEVVNDDRSLGPRLGGSLAYILPLTEAFKFMLPLVQQFPPLGVIFGPITLLTVLLNTIPFIPLILFVTYIICAQDIPRLIRFNLEQAVLIDMALTLPSFILSGLEFSGNVEVASILGGLTFALTFGISVYAVLCNLDGKDPDGVPFISNVTKNVVDRGTFFDPPKEDK